MSFSYNCVRVKCRLLYLSLPFECFDFREKRTKPKAERRREREREKDPAQFSSRGENAKSESNSQVTLNTAKYLLYISKGSKKVQVCVTKVSQHMCEEDNNKNPSSFRPSFFRMSDTNICRLTDSKRSKRKKKR